MGSGFPQFDPLLAPNSPAKANDINDRFALIVGELNELGAKAKFQSLVIDTGDIARNAVTTEKIDLVTNPPSVGTDPATRDYVDSNLIAGLGNLLGAWTKQDSASNDILANDAWRTDTTPDMYDYNYYRANEDGFLIAISNEVNDPWIVIMASADKDEVTKARIGKTHGTLSSGYMDVDETADTRPSSIIRAEQMYKTDGSQTAVISAMALIRKDEFFKIHCITNTSEAGSQLERCIFVPLGTSGQVVDQGSDNSEYS